MSILMEAAKSPAVFRSFFKALLTPSEYDEVALRWQIVKRLAAGEPQRSIAKDLGVGIATVTRGSRELSDPKCGFHAILKR